MRCRLTARLLFPFSESPSLTGVEVLLPALPLAETPSLTGVQVLLPALPLAETPPLTGAQVLLPSLFPYISHGSIAKSLSHTMLCIRSENLSVEQLQ